MSAVRSTRRRRTILALGGAALALCMMTALSGLTSPPPADQHDRMGTPVLPGFAQSRSQVQRIRFTMADDTYNLVRAAEGWVMQESGNYPIRADRLAALAGGLETLTFDARRTADPAKLDALGLGDPAEGGTGVRLEIFAADARPEHEILVGRKAERLYVRAPADVQTYRVQGDLPPFYNRRAWLDFDIIDIEPAAIRSVRITDASDQTLYLSREPGADARSFRPAPPDQDDRLISRLGASTSALAITRLSALDVKPAAELTTQPIARHISETFDGLEVDLRAFREPDGLWVTFRAVEAGEGARRAEAINGRAETWAFRLSDYDFEDFTPAVASLVDRAG